LDHNPVEGVERMRGGMGKNIAHNKDQQLRILAHMQEHCPEMLLFVRIMFFTMMRTQEISLIQVKHIELYGKARLYVPRENSKNALERHVDIVDKLLPDIRKMVAGYPGHYYLFGKGFLPGLSPMNSKKIGQFYSKAVLKPLDMYGKGYTLYSWKHTGVVSAKRNGMTDAAISQQAGWRDHKSYQVYLKSLGLMENTDYTLKMPDIGEV
jgi:integrase